MYILASVVQLARTFPCQGKGRRFEPGHSLHKSCRRGGIGRHAGLKILWPLAVSVRVRSPVPLINKTAVLMTAFCFGGHERNRTADRGFADPCLTTWLRGLNC